MTAAVASIDRRKILGGSDVAAVLGVSDYMTPLQLWQQKVGLAANDSSPDRLAILERGRKLEPFIRDMTIDKLRSFGHEVELLATNKRYRHPKHKFLSVEIDFELRVDGEEINADAKSVNWTVRKQWGREGSEDVPLQYAAQFMQGLGLAPGRRRRCLAAALRSFDDVEIYWTVRDDETIAAIEEKCVRFWVDHVKTKIPPDPVTFADVRALFSKDDGSSVEATDTMIQTVDALKTVKQQIKDLQSQEERLKFAIAEYMGPKTLLTAGVRDLIRWETGPRKFFDEKAFRHSHPDWYELGCTELQTRVMRFAGRR